MGVQHIKCTLNVTCMKQSGFFMLRQGQLRIVCDGQGWFIYHNTYNTYKLKFFAVTAASVCGYVVAGAPSCANGDSKCRMRVVNITLKQVSSSHKGMCEEEEMETL